MKKIILFLIIVLSLALIINFVIQYNYTSYNYVCSAIGDKKEYYKKLKNVETNASMIRYLKIYNGHCKEKSLEEAKKLDDIHKKLMLLWGKSNDLDKVIGAYYWAKYETKDINKSNELLKRARELGWDQ